MDPRSQAINHRLDEPEEPERDRIKQAVRDLTSHRLQQGSEQGEDHFGERQAS